MSQQPFNSDYGFSTTGNITANAISTNGTGGDITLTGGNITGVHDVIATGNITTAANLDIDGNAQIGGNLFVVGNINFTGNVTQISGNSGSFFGNAAGVGALYTGIPVGYSNVVTAVIQSTADLNDYTQINIQNINHANTASMEYVITGDLGTDTTDYLDIGFSSSAWDGTQTNSLGTAVGARDGYLYVQGGGGGGNLVIGTTTAGRAVKFNVGGPDLANTRVVIDPNTGLTALDDITGGNLFTAGNVSATGNVTGNYILGNVAFATGVPATYGNSNVTTLLAAYGSNTISTTGNITGSYIFGNGSQLTGITGSYGDSNVVTLLSAYGSNTVSTTGNITTGNLRTGGNVTFTANSSNITFNNGAYITGNTVGREGSILLQPYTGAGSTFPGVKIGGAGRIIAPNDSVSIILNTADVTIQVAQKITVGTASTSNITGALQVTGGAGVSGNIYAGGLISATGNINATGNVTVSGTGGVSQPNLPAFRVYGTSSTNIAANTTIASAQGTTVDYNQGSSYNNTTGIFTAPVAGIYNATATLRVGSTGGLNQASIQKNSSSSAANVIAFWEITGTGNVGHMAMAGTAKLAVGDTLRLQVLSGNVNFDSNDSWSVAFLG